MCTITFGLFCVNLANIFVHWPKLTAVKAKVSPSRKQFYPVTLELWLSRITDFLHCDYHQEVTGTPTRHSIPGICTSLWSMQNLYPNAVEHAEAVDCSLAIDRGLFRVQRTVRLSQKALVHIWKESNTYILIEILKYCCVKRKVRFSQ